VSNDRLIITVPSAEVRQVLSDVASDVELIDWDMTSAAPLDTVDIVIPPYMRDRGGLAYLADMNVRLVQSLSLGYDGVEELLPKNVVFANARSVHEASTSELTVALILASQRGIPEFVREAGEGRWSPRWHESLADRTVLLVGYGGVGKAIEARLLPFETKVVRVARSERVDERGTVYAMASLPELLPFADIVVIAVPLTDETTHLVNDEFLSAIRTGGLLVNIARGPVADTDALVAHATSGHVRLALDVTDPEPLPSGHPLFKLPNVLITPHIGGATTAALPRTALLLKEQIARLRAGDEPLNVVLRT
jgi:phosphoglycerate dehydrogenase-like enzyme